MAYDHSLLGLPHAKTIGFYLSNNFKLLNIDTWLNHMHPPLDTWHYATISSIVTNLVANVVANIMPHWMTFHPWK
jgi:hypothetical protein